MRRCATLIALLLTVAASEAAAQVSLYGVLGVGYVGRPSGVRSRSLGSSLDAVDRESALNPAAVGDIARLTVAAASITSFRNYTVRTGTVEDLRDTRFPYALIAGVIPGTPITFAANYSIYAERSFDLVTLDTLELRGDTVFVADETSSIGAVADIRGAIGWELFSGFVVGGAVHILTGSTQDRLTRAYSDSLYTPLSHESNVSYSGFGFSAGLLYARSRKLRFGLAFRSDNSLDAVRDSIPARQTDLPMSVSGGVEYRPDPRVMFSTTVAWTSWSDAAADVAVAGTNAFDTWSFGVGAELNRGGKVPVRLGFRYAQMPFSNTPDQPREMDLALGVGFRAAGGRALFDVGMERAMRDGGGASERAWQLSLGILVLP
jgi:opacity protein-like surface antigen